MLEGFTYWGIALPARRDDAHPMITLNVPVADRPRRWIPRMVLAAFIIVVGGLGLVGWILAQPSAYDRPEGARRTDVGNAINAWVDAANPGDRLHLAEVTDFDWDRVVILPPYASNEMARAALGFAWNAQGSPLAVTEGGSTVAFALGRSVVGWTTIASYVNLPLDGSPEPLALDRAAAVLTWSNGGLVSAR